MAANPAGRRYRQIAALAVLILLSLVLGACNTVFGPTRPDANWRVYDTAHFSLYVRPGSFADENAARLGDILDDHYEHARRALGLEYSGRISAFLYDSPTDADPDMPSSRSGVGFPVTAAMSAVCVAPLDSGLAGLLTHEANHVIFGRGIGPAGTSFMSEGMASAVMSPAHYPVLQTNIHSWARGHRPQLLPIRELMDDSRWEEFPDEIAYKSSASFLLFLMERYGAAPVRELFGVTSSDFERRAGEIFGRSLDELEADWLRFLG